MEPNLASFRVERLIRELEKPHSISSGPLSLRTLPTKRDSNGRFAAPQTMHQLLDGVAELAAAASQPQSVSKRAWDASRSALGRFDLPTANTIRRRIGLPWSTVLLLAVTVPAKRSQRMGAMLKRAEFKGDDKKLRAALRFVAHRVGEPLDRLAYDIEAVKIDAERARRKRPALNLPHSDTVVDRLRSWASACEGAGVEPAQPVPPPHHRARPAVELLDEFISETGLLPYRYWFERWCKANDIPLGRDARQWDELIAAVRERRAARDEPTPLEVTRSGLPAITDVARIGRDQRRRPKRRTREEALASLRRYKDKHLAPGQGPRQKHYMHVAKKDRELLAASTLTKHGRFQDLCREAGI